MNKHNTIKAQLELIKRLSYEILKEFKETKQINENKAIQIRNNISFILEGE